MENYFSAILFAFFCLVPFGSFAQELKSEKIMELYLPVFTPVSAGSRIIYPIKDGTVSGIIDGKVLDLGGDFGTVINETTFKLDVRLVIQTNDSATIYMTYTGYFYTDAETNKLIESGIEVDPSKYYIRINPVFETTSPKYDWLNHTLAIGTGMLTKTGVIYTIYAIK